MIIGSYAVKAGAFDRSVIGGINRFTGDLKAAYEYNGIDLDDIHWMSCHLTDGVATIDGKYCHPVKRFQVVMREHGFKLSEPDLPRVSRRSKEASSLENPMQLSVDAQHIGSSIPGSIRMRLLNNVFCIECGDTGIRVTNGSVERGMLVLKGECTRCGQPVARCVGSS